ncbi:MAG: L-threonylcarbamoyladenylate synthase [Candidatus Zixiibacteriota bacterium]
MSSLEVVSINRHKPEEDIMIKAVRVLGDGKLVVAPTETRYGLLTRADRREALKKLYRAKARPDSMPTAVFVGSREEIFRYGEISDIARFLTECFLPGPLTLVLRAAQKMPAPLVVVDGKIGVRLSSSPVIGRLMAGVSFPLTATSANLSGRPEHDTVEEIVDDLGEAVELYLDGGVLNFPTSTVVDCSKDRIKILRSGAIAPGEIKDALMKAGFDA